MSMRSVLLIDDDFKLCAMLQDYLARHQIQLTVRNDGEQGLDAVQSGRYELLLLDVTLPRGDGFEVLARLRSCSDLPVIMLTARGDAADRVRGLRMGADDYLPKPFDVEELIARVYAILRRSTVQPAASTPKQPPKLQREGLILDPATRSASYHDQRLDLTDLELSLLEAFLQSPGVVLAREQLVHRVFRRPFHPLDRSLDMYVSRLRRKLRISTPLGDHIQTIRNSGYRFSAADANALN